MRLRLRFHRRRGGGGSVGGWTLSGGDLGGWRVDAW